MTEQQDRSKTVVLGETTRFEGVLRFSETVCIRGKFKGTIDSDGVLIVDKGAVVEADHITVHSLLNRGVVKAQVRAAGKVDLLPGSHLKGDIKASALRIADGVLFEGQCSMTEADREVEIFSRPLEEIKADLQRSDD